MNKTFKVVFNKARGALIAVNEATSSVQKKGTKTVVAAAVFSVVCGAAVAANTTISQGVLSWDGEAVVGTVPETGVSLNVGQDGAISISASGVQSAGYGVLTNRYLNEENKTESLSSKGIAITGSTFTGNKSANAGGALGSV